MELIREDYLKYVDQLRRSLSAIRRELATDKARDELDAVERILTLFKAEASYRADHLNEAQSQLDAIAADLAPALSEAAAAPLKSALDAYSLQTWASADAKLDALHNLLQHHLPLLGQMAQAGNAAAGQAQLSFLKFETTQLDDIFGRRRAFGDELTSAADDGGAAAIGGTAPLTVAKVEAYLRTTFPGEPDLRVESLFNVPGGKSKETTLITLSGVTALPARVVMRRDIEGGLVPSKTVEEYKIIELVDRSGGVPVPKPLHSEADKSKLGGSFILVAAVEGKSPGDYFPGLKGPVPDKEKIGLQLAGILAQLHRIDIAGLKGTHIEASVNLTQSVRQTIESTYAQAASFDAPSRVHIEMAYQWLMQNLHLAEDTPCLIHCDVGLHNILVKDGEVTSLLDWELACLASPAREIAKILHVIDFCLPRQAFFEAYLAAGGPQSAVDPDRLNFYAIMNYMVTAQRARYANDLFFSGKRPSIVMALGGYESRYRTLTLLSNALKAVYPQVESTTTPVRETV